jgi:hypothetical protein
VNPAILAIESIRVFVAEELEVGEVRFPAKLSEIVADLVFQNAAEPASLRRAASEFVYLPDVAQVESNLITRSEHPLTRFLQLGNPGTGDLAFQSQCHDVPFGFVYGDS